MGVGTKMIIIMMSISFLLWFSGLGFAGLPMQSGLLNTTCDNVSDIHTNCTIDKNTMGIMQSNNSFLPNSPIIGFINTFGYVFEFVTVFLLGVFFAPVTTLWTVGAPAFIVLMVGAIWVVMYIVSIASFVRGWDF